MIMSPSPLVRWIRIMEVESAGFTLLWTTQALEP